MFTYYIAANKLMMHNDKAINCNLFTVCCSSLFQKQAKGQDLFDQIVYHLDLVETDYFGLLYMDAAQVSVCIFLMSAQFFFLQK